MPLKIPCNFAPQSSARKVCEKKTNHQNAKLEEAFTELTSKSLKLKGKGKLIRHISFSTGATFASADLKALVLEAKGLSEMLNPELVDQTSPAKSMVMSISPKKLRPNNK